MKKCSLFIFTFLIVSMSGMYSQESDIKYVPETDKLVLDKLEKWQDLKFLCIGVPTASGE